MSVESDLVNDLVEIALVVVAVGAIVAYVESKTQSSGGVAGLAASIFSWASGPTTPATPGDGAIPDMTTLNTSNATQSPVTNDLLNSSLIMQSIGM
jgi:hypothetical protein